jgi:hypothetical protein
MPHHDATLSGIGGYLAEACPTTTGLTECPVISFDSMARWTRRRGSAPICRVGAGILRVGVDGEDSRLPAARFVECGRLVKLIASRCRHRTGSLPLLP